MNHMKPARLLTVAAAFLAVACTAGATPFEPQFTIVKIAGTCEVQLPGTNEFSVATEGMVCPYETVIRSAAASSCILSFSQDNGCLICQNTTVKIDESMKNKKHKILRLSVGEIEFNLEPGFRKRNRLSVETPSAILDAIACTCAIEHKIIGDLKTSNFRCTEGDVEIAGDYFSITGLGANEHVTVAETPKNDFIRIKVVIGEITLTVRDTDGSERKIILSAGDELTIMASDSQTNPAILDVVYKIVFADPQKAELAPWQATFQKPDAEQPDKAEDVGGPTPPLPKERKWSHLTVAPPVPTVTPVGRQ
ncbi:MAG: hypothetical protein WCL44_04985 [bacterium]